MRLLRLVPVMALALSGVLVSAGSVGAASSNRWNPGSGTASNWSAANRSHRDGSHGDGSYRHRHGSGNNSYDCTGANGGIVPPGTYDSILISGVCYMPAGTIDIRGDLTIAPGALLDAANPGDPAGNPILPATVLVGGNVWVGSGAVLILGCSPAGGCHGVTYDRIGGDLTANDALGVVVQAVAIDGNASLDGGGGGVAGAPESGDCFLPSNPPPAPWSEDTALSQGPNASPVYSDFEDSTIGGDLSVIGLQSCWLGSLRDQVAGNVTFANNTMSDPDALEVSKNVIGGDLTCFNNLPAVQFGDGGTPNIVAGHSNGECGFDVVLPNPAPQAMAGPSVNTNIAVRTDSLGTYFGTHTQIGPSVPLPIGTPNVTASGDTLAGEQNTVVFAGTGPDRDRHAGSRDHRPDKQVRPLWPPSILMALSHSRRSIPAHAALTARVAPYPSPPTGQPRLRAGPTAPSSSRVSAPTPPATTTGLATLAGFGTFWGSGATLQLVEHLSITGTAPACPGSQGSSDSHTRFGNHNSDADQGNRSNDGNWQHTHHCHT